MVDDLNKLAREIIEQNQYMTIGSSEKNGNTWVSPVVYAYDKNWSFHFISMPGSKHCQNFEQNSKVSLAIFDSHQLHGEGVGLQIEGVVVKLTGTADVLKAAGVYYKRKYPYQKLQKSFDFALKTFLKRKTYYFYKVIPTKVWMNNPNSQIDERVEINLK